MSAIEIASALARRFEGFYSRPYLCPAGVATVGFGATRYEDGRPVSLADPPITKERAEQLLQHELRGCLATVLRLCPVADTEGRIAALVDFTFNLGSGRLHSSTLRRKVNAGQWDQVPAELAKWVRGGGKILPGLVARRHAEAMLLRGENPVS